MREQAIRLYHGVTNIDDDIIEEAQEAKAHKNGAWRRWGAVAACLALVIGVGIWLAQPSQMSGSTAGDPCRAASAGSSDGSSGSTGSATTPQADDGSGGTLPGGIRPVLRVGDTLYQWAGMAMPTFIAPSGQVVTDGRLGVQTALPEGFAALGELSGVTREEPTKDLQLQAGFEASGTVYIDAAHPEAVYVLMTTDWFEGQYVRFTSDALGDGHLIAWQGRLYCIHVGYSEEQDRLRELPDGFEQIGTLRYVGQDSVPEGDLETNCRSDGYAMPLDGRAAYADPADESAIYVYERQYWSGGEYDMWLRCPLWEA